MKYYNKVLKSLKMYYYNIVYNFYVNKNLNILFSICIGLNFFFVVCGLEIGCDLGNM